jgi:hypothetical protein
MGPADLQRYKRLLLRKRRELFTSQASALTPVPAAGGWDGDLADQANADAEAELQNRLHKSDGRLFRAIRRGTGSNKGHMECVWPTGSQSLELAWEQCLGRIFAVNAKRG